MINCIQRKGGSIFAPIHEFSNQWGKAERESPMLFVLIVVPWVKEGFEVEGHGFPLQKSRVTILLVYRNLSRILTDSSPPLSLALFLSLIQLTLFFYNPLKRIDDEIFHSNFNCPYKQVRSCLKMLLSTYRSSLSLSLSKLSVNFKKVHYIATLKYSYL